MNARKHFFDHNRELLAGYQRAGSTDAKLIGLMDKIADHMGWTEQASGYITPAELIRGFILAHEGGMSVDPKDNGNHFRGQLVGSKYGVTGAALQAYRDRHGINEPVTRASMERLELDTAVQIGVESYYEAPGFATLPWNRVTMSVVDMGWGAGPRQAIKLLQRMVQVADDGQLGPQTVAAFTGYVGQHGEEATAKRFGQIRDAFYASLNQPRFLKGWKNRTASFLPGTKWWKEALR